MALPDALGSWCAVQVRLQAARHAMAVRCRAAGEPHLLAVPHNGALGTAVGGCAHW